MFAARGHGTLRRSAACLWTACALSIACYQPRRPRLLFEGEPGAAVAGAVVETVRVVARDDSGHRYAGYVGPVHLRIEGASATLCGHDAPSVWGLAEFSSLVIDRPAMGVRLVAEAIGAEPARSAPFDVAAPVPLPEVVAFACEPAQVSIGATGTLSWSVVGASGAEILPIGAVPATGSMAVAPYADGGTRATYELRASAAGDPPLRFAESGRSRGGGAGTDVLTAIDAFPDGSAIAVGTFEDPAQFGGPLQAQTPSSSFGSGAFIARLRADGGIAWSRALTGAAAPNPGDTPAAAAAGPDGGVFLLEGASDHLVVGSLDADGGVIWERRSESAPLGDRHGARARGIAALRGGGAAVSATADGALRLAADGPDALLLENGDAGFGVLAVHGADGGLEWGRKSGSALRAIAAESAGGVYALGTYGPEAAPGGATEPGCTGPPSGSFLGRYAADGGIAWVQCLPQNLQLVSLAVDRDDAAIAAGSAIGSFVIPPGAVPVDAGGPGTRAIVVRWDPSGLQSSALLLPDRGRGPPFEAWAVASLPDGSILVTGGAGPPDRGFLARYDRAGSVLAFTDFPSAIRAGGLAGLPGGGFWIATSYRGAIGTCGAEQRSTPGSAPGIESIDALALRYDPVNFRLLEVRPP